MVAVVVAVVVGVVVGVVVVVAVVVGVVVVVAVVVAVAVGGVMRRAAKVDANHALIVKALRKAGAAVTDLSRFGDGVADLLVSFRKEWLVMEVKDGKKPPSERKLTAAQTKWHAEQEAIVWVVKSEEEALTALGVYGAEEEAWRRIL